MTPDLHVRALHEEVLYPVCRVRTAKAGGSGTALYSRQNKGGEAETYILTNWHVIEAAINIKEEWDPYLKRSVKKEVRSTVYVDRFRYERDSTPVGSESIEADIMAWDKDEDLALIRPRTRAETWRYVAKLYPRGEDDKLRMFQPVRAVGCSLLHEPFSTVGELTGFIDEIDDRRYYMASSLITFGNSGGAVFLEPDHLFLGVPSRLSLQGWGDAANWMGYFVPPFRWYAFLEKHEFAFIWNGDDPAEYHARREHRMRRAERALEALRQGMLEESDLGAPQEEG